MKTSALCFVSLLLFSFSTNAQTINKPVSFGFNFGINRSFANIQDEIPVENPSQTVSSKDDFGFSMGVISNIRITKKFYVNPRAEFVVNTASATVRNGVFENTQTIRPYSLAVKTHFTYLANDVKLSPYFFVGPNYRAALNQHIDNPTIFPARNDWAIDFGFGLNMPFEHFKFAPEIRYSLGLGNATANPAFREAKIHMIHLAFNFYN